MNEINKKYQKFCGKLKDIYLDMLRGEDPYSEYILNMRPSEKIMIGILDSDIQNDESVRYTSMPLTKVQFFVDKNTNGKIKISIKGNLFYIVLPSYEEEILCKNERIHKLTMAEQSEVDKEERQAFDKEEIYQKYKRIRVDDYLKDITVELKDLQSGKKIDISDIINSKIRELPLDDAIGINPSQSREMNEKGVLDSKEKYDDYISRHQGNQDSQIIKPCIKWEFKCYLEIGEIVDNNDLYGVTVVFMNVTPKTQDFNQKDFEDKQYCIPLYNVGLKIDEFENVEFKDIELKNFQESYKVESKIKCKGEWISAKYADHSIITENVPTYIQHRLITRKEFDEYTTFKVLQKDPVNNLKKILEGMNSYLAEIKAQNITNNAQFNEDINSFKREIKRFERGIEILDDPELGAIKKAFISMNQAFENPHYDGWRLFQIVFIVSMISDIVYNDNKDYLSSEPYNYNDYNIAETIFFPTGGGKTEAFLGTTALSMFYDRYIGKNYGVNTIIKYPLRLLSVQQLERTLEVIERANEVLLKTEEIKNCELFTLGYFVGSSNTPNEIKESEKSEYEHKKRYILVDKCTKCGKESIDIVYDDESKCLIHKCTECNHVLPLYIVDDDIYRFLPTVIISTVDKLASISFKDDFINILGGTSKRCKKHGFAYAKNGCKYNIHDELVDVYENQKGSIAPSLFIQDEVHLLKESLGVFSSHYESFISYYISNLLDEKHRRKTKNICATATINGADNLISELYTGKICRIFPSSSTNADGSNFYATVDYEDISRYIVGFAPFGDSINARIEYAVSAYRKILYDMYFSDKYNYLKDELGMTEQDFKKMIFYYWTTIVYFRSKNDNNKLRNTFEQQGNDGRFAELDDAKYNIVRMTGDEEFSEIKESLNNMSLERNKVKAKNLVLATSTISHGVDSKDFNNIFFYGIPSNTAEYIQSYSRVGRTYTGMVIDIIRLARNRDVSFLKYFNMMHKYKDYLIDENRINSKSVMAMYHTLPGLFLSLFRHYYSKRDRKQYSTASEVNKFFYNGDSLNENNIIDFIEKMCAIYNCKINETDTNLKAFSDNLQRTIIHMIEQLKFNLEHNFSANTPISRAIEKISIGSNRPMSSLRDVDVTYNITLRIGGESNEEE